MKKKFKVGDIVYINFLDSSGIDLKCESDWELCKGKAVIKEIKWHDGYWDNYDNRWDMEPQYIAKLKFFRKQSGAKWDFKFSSLLHENDPKVKLHLEYFESKKRENNLYKQIDKIKSKIEQEELKRKKIKSKFN